jgi:hypothetical protein
MNYAYLITFNYIINDNIDLQNDEFMVIAI